MARRRKQTQYLTAAAICVALGVVLLALGSLIEVLDISMAVLASLTVVFARIELRGKYPYLVFAATALLSLLLLPQKTPALLYACFAGFYPILKGVFEGKLPRALCFAAKVASFLCGLVLYVFLSVKIFFIGEVVWKNAYLWLVLPAVGVFVVYDIALTRLITAYFTRLRSRLRLFPHE